MPSGDERIVQFLRDVQANLFFALGEAVGGAMADGRGEAARNRMNTAWVLQALLAGDEISYRVEPGGKVIIDHSET